MTFKIATRRILNLSYASDTFRIHVTFTFSSKYFQKNTFNLSLVEIRGAASIYRSIARRGSRMNCPSERAPRRKEFSVCYHEKSGAIIRVLPPRTHYRTLVTMAISTPNLLLLKIYIGTGTAIDNSAWSTLNHPARDSDRFFTGDRCIED